jgi:hypothetical protein
VEARLVTPPTAERAAEVASIAAKLTKARQAMVLALPADGSWGRVPSRSVAKRAWWSMIPGVIEHKHCPEDAAEWALSDLGLLVRQHLMEQAS